MGGIITPLSMDFDFLELALDLSLRLLNLEMS